jgi:hypothetical protein
MDGTDGSHNFVDSSPQAHSITPIGNVRTSTAQSKFSGASAYFGGSGDYLSIPDSADWNFAGGDFTIDFWVRFNSIINAQMFVSQFADGSNAWYIYKDSNANGNKIHILFRIGTVTKGYYYMTNNWSVSTGTWYHVAIVRNGSNCYLFIDGTSQTLTTNTSFGTNDVGDLSAPLGIGRYSYSGGGLYLNGWLDEFRISKGVARWTSNFTPPIAPY